ncbi:unnamed protein product [Amoebophrya sp. A120]|nr:unnamed protein product [Amoebophrya sp. A120]|eukprot:GSA120T00022924001.1
MARLIDDVRARHSHAKSTDAKAPPANKASSSAVGATQGSGATGSAAVTTTLGASKAAGTTRGKVPASTSQQPRSKADGGQPASAAASSSSTFRTTGGAAPGAGQQPPALHAPQLNNLNYDKLSQQQVEVGHQQPDVIFRTGSLVVVNDPNSPSSFQKNGSAGSSMVVQSSLVPDLRQPQLGSGAATASATTSLMVEPQQTINPNSSQWRPAQQNSNNKFGGRTSKSSGAVVVSGTNSTTTLPRPRHAKEILGQASSLLQQQAAMRTSTSGGGSTTPNNTVQPNNTSGSSSKKDPRTSNSTNNNTPQLAVPAEEVDQHPLQQRGLVGGVVPQQQNKSSKLPSTASANKNKGNSSKKFKKSVLKDELVGDKKRAKSTSSKPKSKAALLAAGEQGKNGSSSFEKQVVEQEEQKRVPSQNETTNDANEEEDEDEARELRVFKNLLKTHGEAAKKVARYAAGEDDEDDDGTTEFIFQEFHLPMNMNDVEWAKDSSWITDEEYRWCREVNQSQMSLRQLQIKAMMMSKIAHTCAATTDAHTFQQVVHGFANCEEHVLHDTSGLKKIVSVLEAKGKENESVGRSGVEEQYRSNTIAGDEVGGPAATTIAGTAGTTSPSSGAAQQAGRPASDTTTTSRRAQQNKSSSNGGSDKKPQNLQRTSGLSNVSTSIARNSEDRQQEPVSGGATTTSSTRKNNTSVAPPLLDEGGNNIAPAHTDDKMPERLKKQIDQGQNKQKRNSKSTGKKNYGKNNSTKQGKKIPAGSPSSPVLQDVDSDAGSPEDEFQNSLNGVDDDSPEMIGAIDLEDDLMADEILKPAAGNKQNKKTVTNAKKAAAAAEQGDVPPAKEAKGKSGSTFNTKKKQLGTTTTREEEPVQERLLDSQRDQETSNQSVGAAASRMPVYMQRKRGREQAAVAAGAAAAGNKTSGAAASSSSSAGVFETSNRQNNAKKKKPAHQPLKAPTFEQLQGDEELQGDHGGDGEFPAGNKDITDGTQNNFDADEEMLRNTSLVLTVDHNQIQPRVAGPLELKKGGVMRFDPSDVANNANVLREKTSVLRVAKDEDPQVNIRRPIGAKTYLAGRKRVIATSVGLHQQKRIEQEIAFLQSKQSMTNVMFSKLAFRRAVRQQQEDLGYAHRKWSLQAITLFQKVMEQGLTLLCANSLLIATHGSRVTLQRRDLQLCHRLRENMRKDLKRRCEM